MKNNETQKQELVYIRDANYLTDNEVNLVDLAVILIQRKALIATIIIIFTFTGIATAILKPKTYTYSSAIEIGTQLINGTARPIESPVIFLAKLQHIHIPYILKKHRKTYPNDDRKYKIKSSILPDSNIAVLEIKGTEAQSTTLKKLLQAIIEVSIKNQLHINKTIKNNLKTKLNEAKNTYKLLKNSNNNETEITMIQNSITSLTAQVENLHNSQEIMSPSQSLDATGIGRKLIVIISTCTGIFLGVFAAFFAEFTSKVKQRANKNKG